MFFENEEITTETIINDEIKTCGELKRQIDNNQYFVIDPVDSSKMWLNSKDDYYEDAASNIWKLT